MWESPRDLWTRLALGREEFLQRAVTTLIVGGEPPRWNSPVRPSAHGLTFLRGLDALAHGDEGVQWLSVEPPRFVDEYLLPKLEPEAMNGWPDWAVLWPDRAWIIELKTEPGSHRPGQLPYYLRLAAGAHVGSSIDLTYLTGPLVKEGPTVAGNQRYSHLLWSDVVTLIEKTWADAPDERVRAYVEAIRDVVAGLTDLRPSEQRARITASTRSAPAEAERPDPEHLLSLARATARDGKQRAVGASTPDDLELLNAAARALIAELPLDDPTRFVGPWLWKASKTGGSAITPEGAEFGYELRFSRYQTMQIKP